VLPAGDPISGTVQGDVNVHRLNHNNMTILETKVNLFFDRKTEIAGASEVMLTFITVPGPQSPIEDRKCFRASHCHGGRSFIIAPKAKLSDCPVRSYEHCRLPDELFERL
jgi:hypothetical protein